MNRILKISIVALLLSGLIPAIAIAANTDFSKPFPLSLLDYPANGGIRNPWLLDVANIQINSDETAQLQNEEMVAINPTNGDNAVAIWRDFRLGYRRVGVGYTLDAGATWHDTLLYVPPYPWQSDPVLQVDSSGNYFACVLGLRSTNGSDGMFVQKSSDGGISWSDPVTVVDSQTAYFEDKQMMVLGRTPGPGYGNIYIAWARFTSDLSTSRTYFVRSIDGGQSFEAPVRVSDASGIQWPVPAVGLDSTIYVAWYSYGQIGIMFDASTNRGRTWGTDRRIINLSAGSQNINGEILVFPFPALTSDLYESSPNRGNLYIAYMDFNSTDMDIFFTRSTNAGQTWSQRVRLNDDDLNNGADQFHPWISVDNNGVIHAIFYDRRLDVPSNLLFDVYYTKSLDGGLTWSANERITTESSDPGQAACAGLIGEYIGLHAWNDQVQMAWTDTRNGNQDVFSARLSPTGISEQPRNLPSDLKLEDPYPNPFNGSTVITFFSAWAAKVDAGIFDIGGRRVLELLNGQCLKGFNRLVWNGKDMAGKDVASGTYFVRLTGPNATLVKKTLLLR